MKNKIKIFDKSYFQHGGMLVELLLTLSLCAIMLPFVFSFQESRIENAKNIATERQMEYVKISLEKYMDKNKSKLLSTIGKSITRVNISDLENYGLSSEIIEKNSDKFQLRILKTSDKNNMASLQGVVIRNASDITPLRTRQIANIGGDKMGFLDNGRAFGTFGTWRANALEMDIKTKNGLVKTTEKKRGNEKYLWRIPSDKLSDATMLSGLNIGKHNINNVKFLNADSVRFDETLSAKNIIADTIMFNNRITLNEKFKTSNAIIAGNLSSDFKNLEVADLFNLENTAKLSNFNTDNLWVMDLNLSGISIKDTDQINLMKINQITDMTSGIITAMETTVGYTGSITPKLVITDLITDSSNENYYWNVSDNTANFYDAILKELNAMALDIMSDGANTTSGKLFSNVASNENSTVSDFINVISDLESKVRVKYSQLNLK